MLRGAAHDRHCALATVSCNAPVTEPTVANTEAVPGATPVAAPLEETVTTDGSEESHVALLVTSSVVPSDNMPVAVNCVTAPTAGAVPVTAMDPRLEGDVTCRTRQ